MNAQQSRIDALLDQVALEAAENEGMIPVDLQAKLAAEGVELPNPTKDPNAT